MLPAEVPGEVVALTVTGELGFAGERQVKLFDAGVVVVELKAYEVPAQVGSGPPPLLVAPAVIVTLLPEARVVGVAELMKALPRLASKNTAVAVSPVARLVAVKEKATPRSMS